MLPFAIVPIVNRQYSIVNFQYPISNHFINPTRTAVNTLRSLFIPIPDPNPILQILSTLSNQYPLVPLYFRRE